MVAASRSVVRLREHHADISGSPPARAGTFDPKSVGGMLATFDQRKGRYGRRSCACRRLPDRRADPIYGRVVEFMNYSCSTARVVPRRQFVLPPAVDERLELLVSLCCDTGETVSRSAMVAALIWGAAPTGKALGILVRRYRSEMRNVRQPSPGSRRPGPRPLLPRPPS